MNANNIKTRKALITGGASGIGAEVARLLAADGYQVAIADLNISNASDILSNLPGENHIAVQIDISNEESVNNGFELVEKRIGSIDVVVNAAGVLYTETNGKYANFWESGLERWERTMAVNARGTFLVSTKFIQMRLKRPVEHGRLILFSSVAAQNGGGRTYADYAASKAAVLGFMRAAAKETARFGITVNTIAPGQIDTAMLRKNIPQGTPVDSKVIPLGRIGETKDVAAMVRFVASTDAAFITGATFDVNGGQRFQ